MSTEKNIAVFLFGQFNTISHITIEGARAIFSGGSGGVPVWANLRQSAPLFVVSAYSLKRSEYVQSVAGIKKTGSRGTPPVLSLSRHPTHPTPWFLSFGRQPVTKNATHTKR